MDKENVHPGKILSTSQEVEVMVLELDKEKRRVSLGLVQIQVIHGRILQTLILLVLF